MLDLIGDLDVGIVLMCGSRNWTDTGPVCWVIQMLAARRERDRRTQLVVLHGGARGADKLADACAKRLGLTVRAELADWVGKGRAAGPERNQRMLALGPDLVLAFKDDWEPLRVGGVDVGSRAWDGLAPGSRGGTEHMCRIAIAAGVLTLRWSHEHGWERLGPALDTDTGTNETTKGDRQ